MNFVLDTDHCVEILRNRLDVTPHVTTDEPLYVTAIGVSELAYGAHRSSRPAQHLAALEQFLRAVIVLPFDEHAAARYGALKADLERQGAGDWRTRHANRRCDADPRAEAGHA